MLHMGRPTIGRFAWTAACVASLVLVAGPGRAQTTTGEEGVPQLVERASAQYATEVRGIIGMSRHFSTKIAGGPVSHSEDSESGFLMDDGAFLKIAYHSIEDDGKAFDAKKLSGRNDQTNRDWAAGKVFFKEPYDPRFVADYRFHAPGLCANCPAGTEAVEFTSAIKDAQHGNGTMWIETASARVAKLSYSPNALPPHATSGSVIETGGEAIPGLWYVTRIDETYEGRAFLFKGHATFVGTFDHFRRFGNRSEGEVALEQGKL